MEEVGFIFKNNKFFVSSLDSVVFEAIWNSEGSFANFDYDLF